MYVKRTAWLSPDRSVFAMTGFTNHLPSKYPGWRLRKPPVVPPTDGLRAKVTYASAFGAF
jgi:hypothetical protein